VGVKRLFTGNLSRDQYPLFLSYRVHSFGKKTAIWFFVSLIPQYLVFCKKNVSKLPCCVSLDLEKPLKLKSMKEGVLRKSNGEIL
jgi:Gpi18-like mannosyltransferase